MGPRPHRPETAATPARTWSAGARSSCVPRCAALSRRGDVAVRYRHQHAGLSMPGAGVRVNVRVDTLSVGCGYGERENDGWGDRREARGLRVSGPSGDTAARGED